MQECRLRITRAKLTNQFYKFLITHSTHIVKIMVEKFSNFQQNLSAFVRGWQQIMFPESKKIHSQVYKCFAFRINIIKTAEELRGSALLSLTGGGFNFEVPPDCNRLLYLSVFYKLLQLGNSNIRSHHSQDGLIVLKI